MLSRNVRDFDLLQQLDPSGKSCSIEYLLAKHRAARAKMRSPQTDKLSGRAEAAWVLLNANMGDIWVPLRMTLFTVLSAMRPDKENKELDRQRIKDETNLPWAKFRSAGIDLRRLGQSPRPIPAMLEIPGTNCPEDRRNGLEL
ncbi:MAG: hypothetical protein WBP65_22650, partial [Candidatus Sulfotelmatobacter sp.]